RLEKAGLVRRERDPNDGRKVIVRLERGKDEMSKVRSILDSVAKTWDEVASRYDDEQIAFLLEFLKYSNTRSRKELAQLQHLTRSQQWGRSSLATVAETLFARVQRSAARTRAWS